MTHSQLQGFLKRLRCTVLQTLENHFRYRIRAPQYFPAIVKDVRAVCQGEEQQNIAWRVLVEIAHILNLLPTFNSWQAFDDIYNTGDLTAEESIVQVVFGKE